MADIILKTLLTKLTQLLRDEAELLSGVEGKVLLLQQELEMINAFLIHSEGKRDHKDKVVKAVVGQIRNMAWEVQDVIDNYVVYVEHRKRQPNLEKLLTIFEHGKKLHDVNNEIETIKAKIQDIYDNKGKYDIDEAESAAISMEALEMAEMVQRRRSDVEEDEVVGFDKYATTVTNMLLEDRKSREVVSIVGMVGCGKTTPARKVYREIQTNKNIQTNKLFDSRACGWAFGTKESNAKNLLLSLLRSFNLIPKDELEHIEDKNNESDNAAKTNETAMWIAIWKKRLRDHLSMTKYLVVLDDMWGSEVFKEVKDAFPDDNVGSRILITTRLDKVASEISTVDPYKLQRLSEKDSLKLFFKKASRREELPLNLKDMGIKIAEKCKGLPLSIVVIAGILRSKEQSQRVWENVEKNALWYIREEDDMVEKIVRLSYDSLPRRLKPCFLYFGIYPEDYDIPVRQLVHLWIAEGFITKTGNGGMIEEKIAEEYLEELICRNMIQVESRRTDGGVKTCRIHDLLRELCMEEGREEIALEVCTGINTSENGKPRRLSIHGSTVSYMSRSQNLHRDHSSTRSLFSFSKGEYDSYYIGDQIRNNFKLIRVLDMGQVKNTGSVLRKLEESFQLRYLRTRETCIVSIPESTYNLPDLETLDIRNAKILQELSDEIWHLRRLRHLYISGENVELPDILNGKILPNLQTLSVVLFDKKTAKQLELGKFPNLRKLGVCCEFNWNSCSFEYFRRLQCLIHLNTLKVINGSGPLTSVEGFPPNITKITLVGGSCLSVNVNSLGSLSTLQYLKISSSKDSKEVKEFKLECTKAECFPTLLVLKMISLNCVSWNLGEGAMPQLGRLVFDKCELSTDLPSAESFPSLKEVEILWPNKEVVDKVQHLVSRDSCKLTVYPALSE